MDHIQDDIARLNGFDVNSKKNKQRSIMFCGD